MTFFLPLGCGSNWQNNELRYMLRSLSKFCDFDFDIIIYGDPDCKPDWLNANYKEFNRFYPQKALEVNKGAKFYESYFAVLSKLYLFVNSDECPEEFVYIYDDVFLLRSIKPEDIRSLPDHAFTERSIRYFKACVQNEKNRWPITIYKTIQLLGKERAKFNYETHMPLIYKRDLLKEMFDLFPFQNMVHPYCIATLYFNLYGGETVTLMEKNSYKMCFDGSIKGIGCYTPESVKKIEEIAKDKVFCNFNDYGLFYKKNDIYPLQEYIFTTFVDKSKHETDR
jgi:hypothetical protein